MRKRIAIIGAGLSGLTVAHRLWEHGFDATVFEAKKRIGGRVWTVAIGGIPAELGGQNITDAGEAPHILSLIRELDLEVEERYTKLSFRYFDGEREFEMPTFFEYFRRENPHFRSQLKQSSQHARNLQQLIDAHFPQESPIYQTLQTLLYCFEGAAAEKLSTRALDSVLAILSGGIASVHSSEKIKTCWVKGGNRKIVERLAEGHHDKLFLDHALVSVDRRLEGGYLLKFSNGQKVDTEYLVLTNPCSTYSGISFAQNALSSERFHTISTLLYGMNSKVLIPRTSDQIPDHQYFSRDASAFPNNDPRILNLYVNGYVPDLKSTLHHHGVMLKRGYSVDLQEDFIFATEEEKNYHGCVAHSWPADPYSLGSYSCMGAGQEQSFLSTSSLDSETVKTLFAPIESRLYFAGEHTTLNEVHGTMEGAVESGERIARLLLRRLKWKSG